MVGYLEVALEAAEASGKVLMRYFNTGVGVMSKGGMNYVTEADYKSQDTIIKIIKRSFPQHNIFSEEAPYDDQGSAYTWFLDPLDATHNYMRNIPIFGVSIALTQGNNILVGVSYFPTFKQMYHAEKGKGAYNNNKRIHVSKFGIADKYAMLMELKSGSRNRAVKLFKALESEKNRLRALGCASYETALLAQGSIDAFVPLGTNFYDVASGILSIEEAGGKVTDIHGNRWTKETKDYIFSNGILHNRMLSFVRKARI